MLRLLVFTALILFAGCTPRTVNPPTFPEVGAFEPEPVDPAEDGTVDPAADVEVVEAEVEEEEGEDEPPTPPGE